MNKNTIIAALGAGIFTLSIPIIAFWFATSMNNWSRNNGVQQNIELETTTSGALNVREMVESGGVTIHE